MLIDTKYNLGDIVYLKTDGEQKERMIIGINVRANNLIYLLSQGTHCTEHYDYEFDTEVDILKRTTND